MNKEPIRNINQTKFDYFVRLAREKIAENELKTDDFKYACGQNLKIVSF